MDLTGGINKEESFMALLAELRKRNRSWTERTSSSLALQCQASLPYLAILYFSDSNKTSVGYTNWRFVMGKCSSSWKPDWMALSFLLLSSKTVLRKTRLHPG